MRRSVAAAVVIALASCAVACRGGRLFRQYEYQEDVYLDLDGSATVIVTASIPALVALHGFDLAPRERFDRARLREQYESPVTRVARVSGPWRHSGRRFVSVGLHVDDIRRLPQARPFAWSEYSLSREGSMVVFRQIVRGRAALAGRTADVDGGWDGSELVAFRLHLPSRIQYHNVRDIGSDAAGTVERGNILTWEQRLRDRLAARPIEMEARMDSRPILYLTLWLFAGAFVSAVGVLGAVLWWTARRGRG